MVLLLQPVLRRRDKRKSGDRVEERDIEREGEPLHEETFCEGSAKREQNRRKPRGKGDGIGNYYRGKETTPNRSCQKRLREKGGRIL